MTGAEERANHPEGKAFRRFFERLLLVHTGSCWERDILRDNKEILWLAWKIKAGYSVEQPNASEPDNTTSPKDQA